MIDKVFIIGGGPSIDKLDLNIIKDEYVVGCNAAFLSFDFVDDLVFGDCRFAKNYFKQEVLDFKGKRITGCPQLKDNTDFIYYKKDEDNCLSWNPKKLGWPNGKGPNTGGMAINYAVHLGFKNIILIGFDCQMKNKKHNFHEYYKDKHTPNNHVYLKFEKHFEGIAKAIKNTDIEVLNATPGSALECFPKVKLKEVL